MALDRAFQSAVFFYLSCAPCLDARVRKKRKQEAVRGRAERARLEQENPNLYRHPSPSSTNPYWNAEIALGPTLAARGGKRRAQIAEGRRSKTGMVSANASKEPSMVDLSRAAASDMTDSQWNLRPYQREDEELWGSTSNFGGSTYADSIARPQKARTRDHSFRSFRNPPINDLHPATVTTVTSREDVMWMMQPPPVADVMSGKERAMRTRSDSGGSRLSPGSALSRQTSHGINQQRLRAVEGVTPMSRETSSRASHKSIGHRHNQSATTSERDFAIPHAIEHVELQKPRAVGAIDDTAEMESKTILRRRSIATDLTLKPTSGFLPSRPKSSANAADNSTPIPVPEHRLSTSTHSKENSQPLTKDSSRCIPDYKALMPQRSAFLVEGESVHVVHDLKPRSAHGKVQRTITAPESKDLTLRKSGHRHEDSEDTTPHSIRPDMFDSWYTPDFELSEWVHENTKREVRQRWSMDL